MIRPHYGIEDSPTNSQTITPQINLDLRFRLDMDCKCRTI